MSAILDISKDGYVLASQLETILGQMAAQIGEELGPMVDRLIRLEADNKKLTKRVEWLERERRRNPPK